MLEQINSYLRPVTEPLDECLKTAMDFLLLEHPWLLLLIGLLLLCLIIKGRRKKLSEKT